MEFLNHYDSSLVAQYIYKLLFFHEHAEHSSFLEIVSH